MAPAAPFPPTTAEDRRLADDAARRANWKRWGPYLSQRQWGTVREDYSANGDAWNDFPHEHARSRAYRWGEDGLLGICDREGRLHLALALWNGKDPILKERLFGLTNGEGNHGEDVKEAYFHLDSTPTHSYTKALYKYPLDEYPYQRLREENRRRGVEEREFELEDTGVFDQDRYVDVFVEHAKASPDDVLARWTLVNRSRAVATLDVLPTLWFRNTWSWGREGEDYASRPELSRDGDRGIKAVHPTLGGFRFVVGPGADGKAPELLFTENETNAKLLFGAENPTPFVKDAFHEYVIDRRREAVNPEGRGTKAAARYHVRIPAGGQIVLRARLCSSGASTLASDVDPADATAFDAIFDVRRAEADEFYAAKIPADLPPEQARVNRSAYAGLLFSKQFMHYSVRDWLAGDPAQPAPPRRRLTGRNSDWKHLYNRDVIAMPDPWEYPWYAAWDLAFHTIAFAGIDPQFAKEQLLLFLREWYMHPSGMLPAYEWNFSDVNPPVHAWACWRVYKMSGPPGRRDRVFLARVFQKLTLNFTWWVNRKDDEGNNLFSGGFLGLDNIGVFDRSKPLPAGGHLEQADGTAWMAFYAGTMLSMALELAKGDAAYEDMASKFLEHFIAIAEAMNTFGGTGLWDEEDGFFYDQLHLDAESHPMRVRSMVGIVPLFAVEVIEDGLMFRLPAFLKRLRWLLANRKDLAGRIGHLEPLKGRAHHVLAIASKDRLVRVLRYVLDENEFFSPHGVRSLSRHHKQHPFVLELGREERRVGYEPGESQSRLFGGNSNWRGPVWFPMNYLLIEALRRYHHAYGDELKVECPTGSGRFLTLGEVANEISRRLSTLFLPGANGTRPCFGGDERFRDDPHWKDLPLFHEYFDGDTGRGLGASHQTGWTALIVRLKTGEAGDRRT